MTTTNETPIPTTDLTGLIVALYEESLGHDGLGPDSDFYEEGGDSLSAFQIVARLGAALGADVPVALVFTCPTPADLAAAVADLAPAAGATELN
jgi:acyl carrier protein